MAQRAIPPEAPVPATGGEAAVFAFTVMLILETFYVAVLLVGG